jgi:hypothetical protein
MTVATLLLKEIETLGRKAIKAETADDAKTFIEAQLQLLDFFVNNISKEFPGKHTIVESRTQD